MKSKSIRCPGTFKRYCNILSLINGVLTAQLCLRRIASVFAALRQSITTKTGCEFGRWLLDLRVIILYLDGHCAVVRSILSVLLCFLGELVGTRHRKRHSNQIVQTYTKFPE
jgi:prepilin-type processing-associated H-X9-DG protein